jgi:Leucine-rich repeat (LRR) protein
MEWLKGPDLSFFNPDNPFENDIRHLPNKHEIVTKFVDLDYLKTVNLRKCRLSYLPVFKSKQIESLDLSCNNLSVFPEWILDLKNLKYLNLGSNFFEHLPNLENLPLETLKLHKNKFSYLQIPKTIKCLNLYLNNFLDIPDITHLKDLEFFSFGVTKITRLPDWICDFKNLKWLSLVVNDIEYLPENFCNLQNLIGLRLAKNKLKKLPNNIGLCKSLKEITLYSNCISCLPDSFYQLDLEKLNLSKNYLIDKNKIINKFSNINFFSC